MLNSLRFVQGSVAKKDFVPELQHFRIQGGTIRGYNGMMGLCCPINLDLDVSPKATPLIKAIQTCEDTIQLHMTPAGKLSVKSGKFKVLIECIKENYPEVVPEGEELILNGGMLKSLKQLAPFIAEDASRPWARGILFRGQSAFATNNVVLLEKWLGYDFPIEVNVPRGAVMELLRIGEEPERLQVTKNSITFHFAGNKWLRTQTYSLDWPDLTKVLNRPNTQIPIPQGLWQGIRDITPFVDDTGRLYLSAGVMGTHPLKDEESGAKIEIPELQFDGCFHYEQLALLEKVADTLDLSNSLAPCIFYGDNLRGAIIGMRI